VWDTTIYSDADFKLHGLLGNLFCFLQALDRRLDFANAELEFGRCRGWLDRANPRLFHFRTRLLLIHRTNLVGWLPFVSNSPSGQGEAAGSGR